MSRCSSIVFRVSGLVGFVLLSLQLKYILLDKNIYIYMDNEDDTVGMTLKYNKLTTE